MKKSAKKPITRIYLETLSTGELIKLADEYGIDIPPELERIFIIQELLECANEDKVQPEEKEEIKIKTSYTETALLPKQYSVSYVDVLIRDPLWVFVFWEIKEQDRQSYEKSPDFNGYCLRVVPLNEDNTELQSKEDFFTVPVGVNDNARYLGFATMQNQLPELSCRYLIKLGVILKKAEYQIAASQPFCLPALITQKDISLISENPLARLSGVAELSILINMDRQGQ